jgi:hypothetical protein
LSRATAPEFPFHRIAANRRTSRYWAEADADVN